MNCDTLQGVTLTKEHLHGCEVRTGVRDGEVIICIVQPEVSKWMGLTIGEAFDLAGSLICCAVRLWLK